MRSGEKIEIIDVRTGAKNKRKKDSTSAVEECLSGKVNEEANDIGLGSKCAWE